MEKSFLEQFGLGEEDIQKILAEADKTVNNANSWSDSERKALENEKENLQSELANWFGDRFEHMNIAYTGNLTTNIALLVQRGYGYSITLEGSLPFRERTEIVSRPLYPPLSASVAFAWKREQPMSAATRKFIEHARSLLAAEHP